jgi:hypothetical protein
MLKLIHASCLNPPLAGRAYYLRLQQSQKFIPCSIKEGRSMAARMGADFEIIRPSKRSPLTQRQRNERSGRVGWVSDAVVRELRVMLNGLKDRG